VPRLRRNPAHADLRSNASAAETTPPRILFVSSFPPSSISGAAVICRDLLATVPRQALRMIVSRRYAEAARRVGNATFGGSSTEVWMPPEPGTRGPVVRFLLSLSRLLVLPVVGTRAAFEARRWKNCRIVCIQDSGDFLVIGWIASLISRRDLIVFITDDWEAGARLAGRLPLAIARFALPRIARRAKAAWVISERMQNEWSTRFGITPGILQHSVDLADYRSVTRQERTDGETRLVCVGSVYSVNLRPLATLVEAVGALRREGARISLTLYTTSSLDWAKVGLEPRDGFVISTAKKHELPQLLVNADYAVLPLSFAEEHRKMVDVAYPTKVAEYLAAGLPVIVHAPASSTAATFIEANACGHVIATTDLEDVGSSLRWLMGLDADEMRRNAIRIAERHHDLPRVREKFLQSIE
jgi:glycosyltransferase involved in cell wall biosynthesis